MINNKPKNKNPAKIPKDYAEPNWHADDDWEDKDEELIGHARAVITIVVFIVLVVLFVRGI